MLDESYAPATTDFCPIINKMISAEADALLGGGHYADGATLARQLHEQKANLKWVSLLVAPGRPNSQASATPRSASRCRRNGSRGSPTSRDFGPTGAAFTKTFEAKYKIEPDYHCRLRLHRPASILQHAIEQAGSIEPEKVAAALNEMDVTTFFGRTKFATDAKQHGLQTAHEMVLAQWQKKDGKLVRKWSGRKPRQRLSDPVPAALSERDRGRRALTGRRPGRSVHPRMFGILASIIDGVLVGSVYGLAAMGLTLIWGVMNVINLTHGALIVAGMFALYLLTSALGLPAYAALPRSSSAASSSACCCTGSRCTA